MYVIFTVRGVIYWCNLQLGCAEPVIKKEDEPELTINSNVSTSDGTMSGNTFTINLPAISLEHGPFRLVLHKL